MLKRLLVTLLLAGSLFAQTTVQTPTLQRNNTWTGTNSHNPTSNGVDVISATRATDIAPAGSFLNFKSLAGVSLFKVDINGNVTAPNIPGTGSCTNQVVTALNAGAAPTCTTVTSSFTSGTFPPAAHALLSVSHSDTTAAAPVRGDGLFAIGATPTWQRLAHPTASGGYFKWNGTDIVASTLAASGTGTSTACTNQFVTSVTLNADAAPTSTCTTVVLTTDVSGVLPTANGGTGQNSSATFPTSGVVVTEAATETLGAKRITPRVVTMADATSITPTSDTADVNIFSSSQVAGTLTVNAPSGTPTDGQKLVLRLKATNAQTYSFNATYAFSTTVTAPTTLAAGKTDYIGLMWNATNTKWDVVAVDQGH